LIVWLIDNSARENNERWTITDVPDALDFTMQKKDGSLVVRSYVVKVAKWEKREQGSAVA
jgi:hypothetical protein